MAEKIKQFERLAIITELVKQNEGLGRTALMKCLFFLKVLSNVPLPYNFRLYTYGPFDGDVLGDLQYAESLGAVASTVAHYPGGYAYEYRPGPLADDMTGRAPTFVASHRDSVAWVAETFGGRSALDLEMASTLVYVDRALAAQGARTSLAELANKVRAIKPHLSVDAVDHEAATLKEQGLFLTID